MVDTVVVVMEEVDITVAITDIQVATGITVVDILVFTATQVSMVMAIMATYSHDVDIIETMFLTTYREPYHTAVGNFSWGALMKPHRSNTVRFFYLILFILYKIWSLRVG